MAIRWQIQFKSISGTDYSVNIYDENFAGTPTQLIGASSPFETSEDRNDDPLVAIRKQTGYIRFINHGEADSIIPPTPLARFITLTSGNDVLWQGYIQQQQFLQPWLPSPYEISLPIVSAIGMLEGIQLQKGDIPALARAAEYVQLAIEKSGATFDKIIVPFGFSEVGQSVSDLFLRIGLQDRNWFEYKNENMADKTASRYDGVTWLDMIGSLLEFFGYSLYERGTTLHICDRSYMPERTVAFSELAEFADNNHGQSSFHSRTTWQVNALPLAGNDGTASINPPARRAIVEGKINPFDDDTTPQIDTKYLEFDDVVTITKYRNSTPADGIYFEEQMGVYSQIQGANIWTFREYADGAEVTWNSQDLTRDYEMGAFCRQPDGTNVIVIIQNNLPGKSGYGNGQYVVSVKSPTQTFIANGRIRVSGTIVPYQGTGKGTYLFGYFAIIMGGNTTRFKTEYGDYENDVINFEKDIIVPDSGYFTTVELQIFTPITGRYTGNRVESVFVIKNLRVEYIGPPRDVYNDDPVTDTNRFVIDLNPYQYKDVVKNTKLTSYIYGRMGYGVVISPDFSSPLKKVSCEYFQEEHYIEDILLNTLEETLKNPIRKIELPIKTNLQYPPCDYFYYGGNYYKYLYSSHNWRDESQKITIYDS